MTTSIIFLSSLRDVRANIGSCSFMTFYLFDWFTKEALGMSIGIPKRLLECLDHSYIHVPHASLSSDIC